MAPARLSNEEAVLSCGIQQQIGVYLSRLLSWDNANYRKFIKVYLSQYFLQSLSLTLFQAYYVTLAKELDRSGPQSDVSSIRSRMNISRRCLNYLTCLEPKLATTSIIFYSLCWCYIGHMYFGRFFQNWHHKSETQPIVRFYENPAKERKRILNDLDDILDKVLESNINYTKQIIASSLSQSLQVNSVNLKSPYSTYQKIAKSSSRFTYGPAANIANGSFRLDECATETSSPPSPSFWQDNDRLKLAGLHDQIATLSREYDFINRLLLNRTEIWPPHREDFWLWLIGYLKLVIFYMLYCGFWLLVTVSAEAIIHSSSVWRELNNVREETSYFRYYQTFTAVLNMFILNELGSPILAEEWTALLDEYWHLYNYRVSVECYLKKLTELKLRSNSNPISYIRDLRSWPLTHECEQQAVVTYIKFRYAMHEIKPMVDNMKNMAKVFVSFVCCISLVTLKFSYRLDDSEWLVYKTLLAGLFCCFNFMAIAVAAFHGYCKKTINLSWNIVNSSLIDPLDLEGLAEFDIDSEEDLTCKLTLISPHIINLWRRVLLNQYKILDSMTIQVFELITLDYEGIINMNFWILSVLVIVAD